EAGWHTLAATSSQWCNPPDSDSIAHSHLEFRKGVCLLAKSYVPRENHPRRGIDYSLQSHQSRSRVGKRGTLYPFQYVARQNAVPRGTCDRHRSRRTSRRSFGALQTKPVFWTIR